MLLCSSAFPSPPKRLQWHFAILFSTLWLVFWIVWGDGLDSLLACVVFASQLGLSDFFWLVRHCCFLPSCFHNACFKRNSLGLCTRSFLCSFQWQNGAKQQFLNGHVTIPGEPNRTKCLSEKNFFGFNHQLHTVDQSVLYSLNHKS